MELDHVVVLSDDLEAAQQRWREAGFNVTPGGVHADGLTHNALICFADGSYVELLAFRTTAATTHRWNRLRAFPGVIDYAVAVSDLPTFVRQLNARGLNYAAPTEGGRQRPDGAVIHWRTSWPPQRAEGLPFLIEDLTPRELRVPAGMSRNHPNGAQGIAELTIIAGTPERAARDLAILLGDDIPHADQSRTLRIGNTVVHVQPMLAKPALSKRGPGPASFAVALATGAKLVIHDSPNKVQGEQREG